MFWPFPMSMPADDTGSVVCAILRKKEDKLKKAVRDKHQKRIKAFEEKEKDRQGYTKTQEALESKGHAYDPERQELARQLGETWDKVCKAVSIFTAKEGIEERKEMSAIEERFDDLKNRCLLELLPPKIRRIIAKA